MPADLELGAAITVEDTSELDSLTADVAPENGGSGGGTGAGGGGGMGGIMDMLGQMTGLLKFATVALGVIMAVPGLLSGVMRLLEVALLPIGILFQSLLAPLIQRLLKWLVQNDIIGMVERFAQRIVTAISNFVADLKPLIDTLSDLVPAGGGTGGASGQNFVSSAVEAGESEESRSAGVASGVATSVGLAGGSVLAPAVAEFSANVWDEFSSESSSSQKQEEGPS